MSKRRYIFTFAVLEGFVNIKSDIEGDLESGIEEIEKNMRETLFKNSIETIPIALISATQLDTVYPPDYVELPIMVRRSLEQVIRDARSGRVTPTMCYDDIERWLEANKRSA